MRQAGGANAALLADIFAGYVGIGTSRGRAGMAIYDPSAAVAFVAPDLFGFRAARIDVELQGRLTRGRTVVETRASHPVFNAEYASKYRNNTSGARDKLCTASKAANIRTLVLPLDLDGSYRFSCD